MYLMAPLMKRINQKKKGFWNCQIKLAVRRVLCFICTSWLVYRGLSLKSWRHVKIILFSWNDAKLPNETGSQKSAGSHWLVYHGLSLKSWWHVKIILFSWNDAEPPNETGSQKSAVSQLLTLICLSWSVTPVLATCWCKYSEADHQRNSFCSKAACQMSTKRVRGLWDD